MFIKSVYLRRGETHNERALFMDKQGDIGCNGTSDHVFEGNYIQNTCLKAILESVFADETQAFMLWL